ncbi:MAG: hypothetical protein LBM99_00710, partial [Bacillales bacterium]|nr:hypothetical protein [Bacillales bacterium]
MLNQIHKILALNEVGSVNQLLQKFDPKLGINEGIGKYSYLTVESTTPKPYTQSQEINIPLTNSNVDIVEFHRSFFTLNIDLWLRFNCNFDALFSTGERTPTGKGEDKVRASSTVQEAMSKCDMFFIGFKSATDCIEAYRLQHIGVDVSSTLQNNNQIESFLYNQMKPQSEKANKHGSYSLWEDVERADESVCGVYLSYEQLAAQLTETNNILHVQFPVTVG